MIVELFSASIVLAFVGGGLAIYKKDSLLEYFGFGKYKLEIATKEMERLLQLVAELKAKANEVSSEMSNFEDSLATTLKYSATFQAINTIDQGVKDAEQVISNLRQKLNNELTKLTSDSPFALKQAKKDNAGNNSGGNK